MPFYQEKPKHAPHGYHHPDQYWVCGYVDFAQRFRHHRTTPVQAVFVQQRSCGITLLGLASAIQTVAPQYASSVRWSATSAVNPGILISATAFQTCRAELADTTGQREAPVLPAPRCPERR